MNIPEDLQGAFGKCLEDWHQGDVSLNSGLDFTYLADLTNPQTPASAKLGRLSGAQHQEPEPVCVFDQTPGVVVLTQTCDLVRPSRERPYVNIAPLVERDDDVIAQVKMKMRPSLAFVPALETKNLVADLDRIMTVEKAVLAQCPRISGMLSASELMVFADAIARKFNRFAFPDDFVAAVRKLRRYIQKKHWRQTAEGAHLRVVEEVRVQAEPSWHDDEKRIRLIWWFIVEQHPEGYAPDWAAMTDKWLRLFNTAGRFENGASRVRSMGKMSAREYADSVPLDLDHLSNDR